MRDTPCQQTHGTVRLEARPAFVYHFAAFVRVGVERDGALRRVVDYRSGARPIATDGLMLNSRLAQILDAEAGDTLTARFLEGRRAERQLEVVAVVDELFGMGASWGGYESLAVPVNLSDRTIRTAPADGPVIRLQIGLEDTADLMDAKVLLDELSQDR